MISIAQQVGRACFAESRNEIGHGDLFRIREAARDAQNNAGAPIVWIVTVPSGVLIRNESLADTFADTMQLISSEAEYLYLVVEAPDLRDHLRKRLTNSRCVPRKPSKFAILGDLDEAFRLARHIAHREVIDIQRALRRSSPPVCSTGDELVSADSPSHARISK